MLTLDTTYSATDVTDNTPTCYTTHNVSSSDPQPSMFGAGDHR